MSEGFISKPVHYYWYLLSILYVIRLLAKYFLPQFQSYLIQVTYPFLSSGQLAVLILIHLLLFQVVLSLLTTFPTFLVAIITILVAAFDMCYVLHHALFGGHFPTLFCLLCRYAYVETAFIESA